MEHTDCKADDARNDGNAHLEKLLLRRKMVDFPGASLTFQTAYALCHTIQNDSGGDSANLNALVCMLCFSGSAQRPREGLGFCYSNSERSVTALEAAVWLAELGH